MDETSPDASLRVFESTNPCSTPFSKGMKDESGQRKVELLAGAACDWPGCCCARRRRRRRCLLLLLLEVSGGESKVAAVATHEKADCFCCDADPINTAASMTDLILGKERDAWIRRPLVVMAAAAMLPTNCKVNEW